MPNAHGPGAYHGPSLARQRLIYPGSPMKLPTSEERPSTLEEGELSAEENRSFRLERVLRWALGVIALLGVVVALARWLRPELESVGRGFVDRFGLLGMTLGTFLADGFHFPVPPQFYMLMAIAAESPPFWTLVAITLGSMLGGTAGFFLARRLSRFQLVARKLARSARLVERFRSRHGYRMVIAVSMTPIAYSVLCYLAGVYRLPKRLYVLLAALRVPKLVLYYYLVRFGWGFG